MTQTTASKKYGLLGYPLTHSFSPAYWTQRFAEQELEGYSYRAVEVSDPADIPPLLASGDWQGFNVTIPHKQAVIPLLDELSPEASAIQAVNCIKIEAGRCVGYNTDAYGFEQSLLHFLNGTTVSSALVLGSGGAAAAVRYVLRKLAISYTTVSRRRPFLTYREVTPQMIRDHRLIINTTPLGMHPHTSTSPRIDYSALTSDHYCYDLVYNPTKTVFLDRSQKQGAAIKNGKEMLVLQAERSWEIWNQ